jgi:hypothetical protein
MSEIKVNKISQRSGTAITLGNSGTDFQLPSGAELVAQSGSTITIAAGATITNSGTATGFGATGAVNWDTTPKTTTVTAVSGVGYFVDTTSGAITVNLPAGVAGSIVAVSDYANTAATNNISITPNGTDKINGLAFTYKISTNGAAITLIYIDATRGWKDINDATLDATGVNPFITATGGTITTCGNCKVHTFTSPGTFTVSSVGGTPANNTIGYMVVAGGGGGGTSNAAGGGAGGFREGRDNSVTPYTASPLVTTGLTVTATAYPITVGAGGTATPGPAPAPNGNPSIFSTITSAGGGGGASADTPANYSGNPGGSGGGGGSITTSNPGAGGTGNTPPVAPSQGNNGGAGFGQCGVARSGGGGGGATSAGTNSTIPTGGPGGTGAGTAINPSPTVGTPGPSGPLRYFAGGGGSGCLPSPGGYGGGGPKSTAGTVNTGGGAGATSTGGSGIVVIRYKFQ